MQIANYTCPPGSYYNMTLDACVPVSPYSYRKEWSDLPKDLPPVKFPNKPSPEEAVATEIAARKVK